MQSLIKSFSLVLLCVFAFSGCSSFSKTGRQQRAYEKYLRKSSVARVKQQSRFHSSDKPQMPTQPMRTEPIESTESGPQAVPRDG